MMVETLEPWLVDSMASLRVVKLALILVDKKVEATDMMKDAMWVASMVLMWVGQMVEKKVSTWVVVKVELMDMIRAVKWVGKMVVCLDDMWVV